MTHEAVIGGIDGGGIHRGARFVLEPADNDAGNVVFLRVGNRHRREPDGQERKHPCPLCQSPASKETNHQESG